VKSLFQASHLPADPHGSILLLDFQKLEQILALPYHLDEFSLHGLVVSGPAEP
jgi:hypothetical protein